MEISISLKDSSIKNAALSVRRYAEWVQRKEAELSTKLAEIGATVASIRFARSIPPGDGDISVSVETDGKTATIYARGESVAFIEFGTGNKYGWGHPEAGEKGMGPGTYPGKGHWDDPNGWWYGKHQHTFGNPPAMAMYDAKQAMIESVANIAREVFSHD